MATRNSYGDEYSEIRNECHDGFNEQHIAHGNKHHWFVLEIEKDFYKWWGFDFRFRLQGGSDRDFQAYLDVELSPIFSIGIGWLGLHLQIGPAHLFIGDVF